MHAEAEQFVKAIVRTQVMVPDQSVLEFGGLYVNGGVRNIVPHGSWHTVDIVPGPDVDEVADAATWKPPHQYDVGLCLEVLEHTPQWREILVNLARCLYPGGLAIITAACPPRRPHGAYGEPSPPPGQHYENVDPNEVTRVVSEHFSWTSSNVLRRGDVRVVARK